MMNTTRLNKYEELFLLSLKDLREKANSNNRYQLIKASGLLRLLLLDGLIDRVNSSYRFKLKFYLTLKKFRREDQPALTLQKFLAEEWKAYREHCYSVKEIIQTSAHLMGGVHLGEPKSKKEIDLIGIFDYRPITFDTIKSSLRGISLLTIEALEDLESRVTNGG